MLTKKKMIILIVLGVVSFASSFVVSGFLATSSEQAATVAETSQHEQQDVLPPEVVAETLDELSPRAQQLEELIRELRFKIDEYDRRERELDKREKRLEMTQAMLERQARELEGLRIQLTAAMGPLKDAQAELERTRIHVSRQEEQRFRRLAAVYDKMDVGEASQTIVEMCGANQIEDAVKLLLYMNERQAAKMLAEMSNKPLAAELSLLMKRVVEQPEQQSLQ